MDKPAAGLIKDLKSRGLLEDTIVFWTTEFGRMPCSQASQGRAHNPLAFTVWLAGGGIKGGVSYGASDNGRIKSRTNRSTATTSTPPFCACWASTTQGSRTVTTASTAA